jgi:hypothetical protein
MQRRHFVSLTLTAMLITTVSASGVGAAPRVATTGQVDAF